MTAPAVTYTFSSGTTISSSNMNTNFTDIINALTDGTKTFSIDALTCAGATTLNGAVTIGNASTDDLTITGSLASSIPIKTTASYDIGSSTLGLQAIYFGANSQTVNITGSGSMSATWTLTLPVAAGTAGQVLQTNGSGVTSWVHGQTDIHSVSSDNYTITDTDGYRTVLVTTGASDRTITLPTAADNTDRRICIMKIDSGAGKVIVDGEGAETICDTASFNLINQYESMDVECNGSQWYVIGENRRNAQALTDAIATAEGKYVYAHGTSYAGSNSPTVTLASGGGTLSSVDFSAFIPYQTKDGNWRLRGNVSVTLSSATRTAAQLNIAGVSVGSNQAIAMWSLNNLDVEQAYMSTSANCVVEHDSGTSTVYLASFDVAVSAKPSWAY